MQLPTWKRRSSHEGGVRIKLTGLTVMAAVPLVVLAGIAIAQGYDDANHYALQAGGLLQGIAETRFEAAWGTSAGQLAGLAMLVPDEPAACKSVLVKEVDRELAIAAVAVFDTDGHLRCQAGPWPNSSVPAGWLQRATVVADEAGPQLVPGFDRGTPPLATVAMRDGALLVAQMAQGWYASVLSDPQAPDSVTWLLDPSGAIAAERGSQSQSVPTVRTMAALLQPEGGSLVARSAQGVPFAYVSRPVIGGWRVLSAYQAGREYAAAARSLTYRMAEIGVLTLLSLGAIITGAAITFGEPLRRLTNAVGRWQNGAAFEPGPLTSAPFEVRELARSFGEATAALRRGEAGLVQAKERQDLLVLEIHHRVKNNLQIIASLLNLQASRIRVPEARAEFQAARDRVRALATLHRHLYSDGELHTINMRSFLVELCGQLFQAIGETEGERIVLSIEAPELLMSSDEAVPLALIVTEAVTNSVKYAFPAGRKGRVHVSLTEQDGGLDLLIEDDGVGIPVGVTETESGRRDGIGLQLIRGFAKQLGATLAVDEHQGTRYAVRLKPQPSRTLDRPALDAA